MKLYNLRISAVLCLYFRRILGGGADSKIKGRRYANYIKSQYSYYFRIVGVFCSSILRVIFLYSWRNLFIN